MQLVLKLDRLAVVLGVLSVVLPLAVKAQSTGRLGRAIITDRVDEAKLRALPGNTRSEANAANDRGRVPDDFAMEHMLLQLQRAPDQERAVQQLIDDLHNSKAANFHHWLKPSEFGQQYGLAQTDLNAITGWLQSHGFAVNSVYPSGMLIDFSGNSGQVREAFHTEIHYLDVNGARHVANMSDPQVPAALAPAVSGVISMHDFAPHAMSKRHPDYTYTDRTGSYQALVPGDLATIYNLNPLFSSGITGAGQTIAVIEDTDLYDPTDWDTFRTKFGLSQYSTVC